MQKESKMSLFHSEQFQNIVNVETKRYRKQPLDWSETSDDELENGVPLRLRRYNRDKDDKFFQGERFKFSYINPANDKTGKMFSVEETEKPPPYNTSYKG